jgi:hypothetical protein
LVLVEEAMVELLKIRCLVVDKDVLMKTFGLVGQ